VKQLIETSPITEKEVDMLHKKIKRRRRNVSSKKWREIYKQQPDCNEYIEYIWRMEVLKNDPLTIKLGGAIHVEYQVTNEAVYGYIYSYPLLENVSSKFVINDKTDLSSFPKELVDFGSFLWRGFIHQDNVQGSEV
jgi:hypothetical protein